MSKPTSEVRENAPIDMLFNEMDSVIKSIYPLLVDIPSTDTADVRAKRNHAYGLVMVLERLNNELGRTAGVIA